MYLIEVIIYRHLIDHTSRERVDPTAKERGTRERERERCSIAGVGSSARGREVLAVRSPHSTDNVTFFNPRFTLFAPPSRSRGRPQTVTVRLLSLERAPSFAWKRTRTRTTYPCREDNERDSSTKWEFANHQGAREFRARVALERRGRERRRRRREKEEEVGTGETSEGGKICPLSRVPWTSSPERRRWCKVSLYLLEYFEIRANLKARNSDNACVFLLKHPRPLRWNRSLLYSSSIRDYKEKSKIFCVKLQHFKADTMMLIILIILFYFIIYFNCRKRNYFIYTHDVKDMLYD